MRRHLLFLAAAAGCWVLAIVVVFLIVDRQVARAAGLGEPS